VKSQSFDREKSAKARRIYKSCGPGGSLHIAPGVHGAILEANARSHRRGPQLIRRQASARAYKRGRPKTRRLRCWMREAAALDVSVSTRNALPRSLSANRPKKSVRFRNSARSVGYELLAWLFGACVVAFRLDESDPSPDGRESRADANPQALLRTGLRFRKPTRRSTTSRRAGNGTSSDPVQRGATVRYARKCTACCRVIGTATGRSILIADAAELASGEAESESCAWLTSSKLSRRRSDRTALRRQRAALPVMQSPRIFAFPTARSSLWRTSRSGT
jgi:hypothetical protein